MDGERCHGSIYSSGSYRPHQCSRTAVTTLPDKEGRPRPICRQHANRKHGPSFIAHPDDERRRRASEGIAHHERRRERLTKELAEVNSILERLYAEAEG